jgi:hypothetical protein
MVASKCWSTFRRFWRTTRRQRLSSIGWASETSVDLTGPFSHTNFRRRPDRRFAPTAADGERGGKDAHDDPGGRPYIRACETSRNAGSVRHSSSPRSATCLLSRALDPAHFRRVSKARPTAAGLRQLRGLLPYPEAAPSRDRRPGQGGAPQPLCARAFGLIRAGVAPDIDVEISWWFGEDSGSTDAFQCGCRSQTADGPPFYAQIAARRGIDTDECPVIAAH